MWSLRCGMFVSLGDVFLSALFCRFCVYVVRGDGWDLVLEGVGGVIGAFVVSSFAIVNMSTSIGTSNILCRSSTRPVRGEIRSLVSHVALRRGMKRVYR